MIDVFVLRTLSVVTPNLGIFDIACYDEQLELHKMNKCNRYIYDSGQDIGWTCSRKSNLGAIITSRLHFFFSFLLLAGNFLVLVYIRLFFTVN